MTDVSRCRDALSKSVVGSKTVISVRLGSVHHTGSILSGDIHRQSQSASTSAFGLLVFGARECGPLGAEGSNGVRAAKQQAFVGTGYVEAVQTVTSRDATTTAMSGSTEADQFPGKAATS